MSRLYSKIYTPLIPPWDFLQANINEERTPIQRLGSFGVAIALLPALAGFATERWLSGASDTVHVGLWVICSNSSCRGIQTSDTTESYNVSRSFAAMAMCIHVISVVTGCCCKLLGAYELVSVEILRRWEEITALLAAALFTITLTVFADFSKRHEIYKNFRYDWSYWLCLSTVLLLVLSATSIALARDNYSWVKKCKREPPDRSTVP